MKHDPCTYLQWWIWWSFLIGDTVCWTIPSIFSQ